jgi:uncharacterized protein (DUF305 family)
MKKIIITLCALFTSSTVAWSMHHQTHGKHTDMSFQQAMDAMHKNMMIPSTGNIDIDYLQGMIPHHQGAIDMSEELIKKSKDPQLKSLAEKIIKEQKAEIKLMQDLLKAKKTN